MDNSCRHPLLVIDHDNSSRKVMDSSQSHEFHFDARIPLPQLFMISRRRSKMKIQLSLSRQSKSQWHSVVERSEQKRGGLVNELGSS